MAKRELPERPDWVAPGADVLLYDGHRAGRNPVRTGIEKVAMRSFTVLADGEPRFRLPDCSVHMGGTWGWVRYCVPFDSDRARSVLAEVAQRKRFSVARNAVDEWIQHRATDRYRVAAIVALEALAGDMRKEEEPNA